MSMKTLLAIALTLLASAGIWWGYQEIGMLRGTALWELRYLALLCGAVALLSCLEWLLSRLPGDRD